jgi:hypothetical protein
VAWAGLLISALASVLSAGLLVHLTLAVVPGQVPGSLVREAGGPQLLISACNELHGLQRQARSSVDQEQVINAHSYQRSMEPSTSIIAFPERKRFGARRWPSEGLGISTPIAAEDRRETSMAAQVAGMAVLLFSAANPATPFLTAVYTEPLFCFLSWSGLAALYCGRDQWPQHSRAINGAADHPGRSRGSARQSSGRSSGSSTSNDLLPTQDLDSPGVGCVSRDRGSVDSLRGVVREVPVCAGWPALSGWVLHARLWSAAACFCLASAARSNGGLGIGGACCLLVSMLHVHPTQSLRDSLT